MLRLSPITEILFQQRRRLVSTLSPGHHIHPAAPTTTTLLTQNRPLSPYVSIYQPQLTWIMSIGHRVTGAGLAGAVYAFGMASSLNSTGNLTLKICEMVSMAPLSVVLAGKFILAAPFMYHMLNGMRHLIWDVGKSLTLRGVYTSGWVVNIFTLISAGIITFL